MCKSAVYAWSDWVDTPGHSDVPENDLNLEWVYGYCGFDVTQEVLGEKGEPHLLSTPGRNNLFYASDEGGNVNGTRIVYFVSALGIVLDTKAREQAFYTFHDGEISCMCMHPSRALVATAQTSCHASVMPVVSVWSPGKVYARRNDVNRSKLHAKKQAENDQDENVSESESESESVQPESVLSGHASIRVNGMSFDQSGAYLFVVGMDDEHTYVIYDWRKQTVLMKGISGKSAVIMVSMHVCMYVCMYVCVHICVCGVCMYVFMYVCMYVCIFAVVMKGWMMSIPM